MSTMADLTCGAVLTAGVTLVLFPDGVSETLRFCFGAGSSGRRSESPSPWFDGCVVLCCSEDANSVFCFCSTVSLVLPV